MYAGTPILSWALEHPRPQLSDLAYRWHRALERWDFQRGAWENWRPNAELISASRKFMAAATGAWLCARMTVGTLVPAHARICEMATAPRKSSEAPASKLLFAISPDSRPRHHSRAPCLYAPRRPLPR